MSQDGGWVFTADRRRPCLAMVDTTTNEVSIWIDLPAVGYGTAPTLDGRWLLVTMQTANQIAVVDISQMKVVRTVQVGADPVQILVRPVLAYVSCTQTERST
jgi:YVTN family beta-propeller protein